MRAHGLTPIGCDGGVSRRSEVVVRPYRKGDRLFPNGVHRHVSLARGYDAPTEIIEHPSPQPLRLIRRPPPLPLPKPKPKVVVRHDPPSHLFALFFGAFAIVMAALIVLHL